MAAWLVLPSIGFILWLVAPTVLYVVAALLGIYLVWHTVSRFRIRKTYYPTTLPEDVAGTETKTVNVCVIGAGVSGLVAIKELLALGHKVTCFEKYERPGGVFLYNEKKGGVYDSTILTISNYTMAFSDFLEANAPCKYWKHTEYYQYIMDYIEHFQLRTKATLHFNTNVDSMERFGNQWKITTSGATSGVFLFDSVAVCNGTHQFPRIPQYKGQETSKIEICHSETYKRAQGDPRFQGKRVLVVGAGETGADLGAEVADVAKKAFISYRKAPFVIPRYPWNLGLPGDAFSSRAMFYCNHSYIMALHDHDQGLKHSTATPFFQRIFKGFMGLGDPVMGKIAELANQSGGGVIHQFLTKNEAFVRRIVAGTLHEKPEIDHLDGNTVHFTDGTTEDVDTILLCTGYVDKFPFLKGFEIENVRQLYLHAFHPDIGPSVAFIGFVRPSTGGVPGCAEMLARYFALLCSGQRKLPADFKERAKANAATEEGLLRLSAKRVRSLVIYGEYMETLAHHIGCAPNMLYYFFANPRLWIHMLHGPMIGAQYRLSGPAACPEQAEKVIVGGPIPTPVPFRIAQGVSAVLGWIGGSIAGIRPPSW